MSTPKVSVIIPVYKAEQYIEQCVRSLFGQTLDEMEYIFVDDCSPDRSIEIVEKVLEEYPNRKPQVKILRNDQNRGVGYTRQRGVEAATGKYMIHCDPDDWVEVNMYERMYLAGLHQEAEIVVCDYLEERKEDSRVVKADYAGSGNKRLENILTHRYGAYLWNKMISREFWKKYNLRIPYDLSIWEDLVVIAPLLYVTDSIAYIDQPLYHYRQDNLLSLSNKNDSKRILSGIKGCDILEENITMVGKSDSSDQLLLNFKIRAYFPLLSKLEFFNPKQWRNKLKISTWEILRSKINRKQLIMSILAIWRADKILQKIAQIYN